jgi:hypothetical protein
MNFNFDSTFSLNPTQNKRGIWNWNILTSNEKKEKHKHIPFKVIMFLERYFANVSFVAMKGFVVSVVVCVWAAALALAGRPISSQNQMEILFPSQFPLLQRK